MKILITGGAGFIGSNLVHRYAKDKGNEIYIIDNLCTGEMSNIKDVIQYENVHFFNLDVRDEKIIEFIREEAFDYIYNFACPASPKY